MRVVSILLVSILPLAGPSMPDRPLREPLAWLAGCWRLNRGGTVVDEHWLNPLGGMMLGASRTVRNGTVQEYEFMVLRITATGASYEAHPSGQEAATFTSTTAPDGDQVVFGNPTHDFPQKVGYRRLSDDSVVAWIEGNAGNDNKRIDFPYTRVACTAT
jgi:hypothetical protein